MVGIEEGRKISILLVDDTWVECVFLFHSEFCSQDWLVVEEKNKIRWINPGYICEIIPALDAKIVKLKK